MSGAMSSPEGSSVIFRRPLKGRSPQALRLFARRMEREVAGGRAFDCLITGDAEMRRLNRDFRGKDSHYRRAFVSAAAGGRAAGRPGRFHLAAGPRAGSRVRARLRSRKSAF